LQAAMQTFSSPLQRIGAEKAEVVDSKAKAAEIATTAMTWRGRGTSNESILLVMKLSYGHHSTTATPGLHCVPRRLAIDTYSSIIMAGPFRPSMSLN
jgi:hypothetical protein